MLPYFLYSQWGVFVHGHLHYIMRCEPMWNSARVLVAFDIYTEGFVEVDLPNFTGNRLPLNLALLEGRLCLITHDWDVWIMRGYGLNGP